MGNENFYVKDKNGKYIPVAFNVIKSKDWDNKLLLVRIGTESYPAGKEEISEVLSCLEQSDALDSIENASFLITQYHVEFQILGSLKEIADKYVTVQATRGEDLSGLEEMQQKIKDSLKDRTKKVVFLPAPITLKEYREVMNIKKRCDIRRNRRGK